MDDGLHEIFVNTKVNDGSELAALMECFNQTRVTNEKFLWFKRAVDYLKDTKGGRKSMCKIMDEYAKDEAIDATIDAAIQLNATIERVVKMLCDKYGLTKEDALERIHNFKKTA